MTREEYRNFYNNFVYCVDFLNKDTCLVFNRYAQHMVLTVDGFKLDKDSVGFIDFEDPKLIYKTIPITPEIASQLSYKGETGLGCIFLYSRKSTPLANDVNMKDYQARLSLLRRIKASPF